MNNKQRQRNQYKSQTQPGYNQFFGGGDNAFGNIFEDIFSNLFSQGPHSQTGSRSGGANSKGYQYTFFGSGPSGFQFGGPSGGSRRSGGNHYSVPPNFVDRNDIIKSYKKLGVSESASSDEVKKAYRKLALKYHPDKCKKSDCESKMMEINEAYDKVLKDIETKK
ncbi:DnaJ domain-containing protein [Paraphysoderma sedebokerense]|nr:DnaJ domain-containing protein [Paraphysoderma sedebokerense]